MRLYIDCLWIVCQGQLSAAEMHQYGYLYSRIFTCFCPIESLFSTYLAVFRDASHEKSSRSEQAGMV